MPRAFPEPGKGFPKALAALREVIKGGIVADDVVVLSGAAPVLIDPSAYKHRVTSGGTAGTEVVQVPSGKEIGQRVLIVFEAEGNVADVVQVAEGGAVQFVEDGYVGGLSTARATISLDTPGESVLLEYTDSDEWNILYTDGVVA